MKTWRDFIAYSFLLLAGFVILAHNIFPHHHHLVNNESLHCEQSCEHNAEKLLSIIDLSTIDYHDCDECDGCFFQIDITQTISNISLDIFLKECGQIFTFQSIVKKNIFYVHSDRILNFYIANQNAGRAPPLAA